MHEKNFKRVQIETEKILKETQKLLEELSNKEKESYSGEVELKTLSLSNLRRHQELLKNEAQKLKNLEYVVAVVGTMKAGKSMTINAIVGQEILPSRDFPMTTLPTLITHVSKQTEPRLTIKKIKPFNELKNAIKAKISTRQTFELGDIQNLVSRIEENKIEFKTEYKGPEEISHFLRDINDLMRIAKEFGIEPPYEEYTDVDDLPRIEVEFYHLSKYPQEASEARLTLLDTPGPDEFKQSAILKTIFKEQLRKASAVTLVVDYTKMNSESDAKVKKDIEDVAKMIGKKHLFVLLNKFDQRNRDSEDNIVYEEAKRLISKGTLKDKIDDNNVYPISSKLAFYANLGLSELEKNKKIDENLFKREAFAVAMLGEDWKDDIDDIQRVEKKCHKNWEKSYLEDPLNNIIATIHSEALALALEAPLGKLANILQETSNGLKIRERGYRENIKQLKETIYALKNDINNMESISENLSLETEKSVADTKEKLEINIGESIDNIYDEFESTLLTSSNEEEQRQIKDKEYKPWLRIPLPKNLEFLNKAVNKDKNLEKVKQNFKEFRKNGKVNFKKENDAKKFYKNINDIFTHQIEDFLENTEETISKNIYDLSSDVNDNIEEKLGSLLMVIKERFDGEINITLPQLILEKSAIVNKSVLKNSIKHDIEIENVKGDGFINNILHWVNTNWGTVENRSDTFSVESKEIEKNINSKIMSLKKMLYDYIDNFYNKKISKTINKKLLFLKEEIEGYRGEQNDIVKKREANEVDITEEISLAQKLLERNTKLNERVYETKKILSRIGENNV